MTDKNFTRKDLSNKIFKHLGFSKNLSSKIVDDFFETLISEIIKLNKIKISSFGSFNVLSKRFILQERVAIRLMKLIRLFELHQQKKNVYLKPF